MNAAFGTPEILEQILLELPIKDILLVQRVNKTFHATVTDSPRLQQAVFLKPVPGKPLHRRYDEISTPWAEGPEDPKCYTILRNPWYGTLVQLYKTPPTTHAARDAVGRPEASWRRMHVCQPPITAIWVNDDNGYYSGLALDPVGHRTNTCPGGVFTGAPAIEDLENASEVVKGLTYGDMAKIYREKKEVRMIGVNGSSMWKDVEFGYEVKRIERPKPKWLLAPPPREEGEEEES